MKLDTAAFNTCLDSGKYTQLVTDQTNLGRGLGVQSTPTFAVNGQPVVGAQPYENFKKTIDALLAR
jgi:protein-disulfide isomerase